MSKLVSKNWPKEKYSALLPLLQKQFGAAILLLGSKKEFEYNEDIRDENKDILNLCGVYPIRDVGAILSQCDLFIGNDSGIGHYASSLGTKTISIFGSTSPQQARPIGYGKTIVLFKNRTEDIFNTQKRGDVESDIKAMDSISVEDVMSAAKKMLS
jgi:ADP-heptose:LPS heptosyltransferase